MRTYSTFGMCIIALSCNGTFSSPPYNSAPGNPDAAVWVTDSVFRLIPAGNSLTLTIPFRFVSPKDTAYLQRCGRSVYWQLERFSEGQWQYTYSPDCYDVLMAAVSVRNGSYYSDTATAVVSIAPTSVNSPRSLLPGEYRIVLAAFSRMASGEELYLLSDSLPLTQRASAPFSVH
jgi:hypothetical protein